MTKILFSSRMGVAEQNVFENENFLEMIYSSISGYVVLVGAVLIMFTLSLFIPRGIKRELFNSDRRRYAHSQFYIGKLLEQTNLVKSFNRLKYESLKNIDTSQLYANQADNDDLSPLERVEQGIDYQSIFRIRKDIEQRKEMRKIEANLSSLLDKEVSPSTRASESTLGTHSSSGLFSLSSQEWQNIQLWTPENKENLLPNDKPPLGRSTPKTPKLNTESPLSVATNGFRNGGFIILSNGDKDQNVLNYLNENRVKYRIVNALDPKERKRTKKLSTISGITGLYPQIFFVIDACKTPVYIGSRESILALQKNQKLSVESLQAFAESHECDQILTEISNADLDTSYFSV